MPTSEAVRMSTGEVVSAWRRLPARSLAAVYAEQVIPLSALVVAAVLARQSDVGGGRWAVYVFAALLVARVVAPVWTWASLRYEVVSEGLWVATGLVNRRTRFTAWSAVAAVEVDQPWSHRVFGVARLTLRQGGDDATPTVLPGLDSASASALATRARASSPPSGQAPDDATPDAPEAPVYRASVSDLLIASLIYGKFATFGAAVALSALDVLDRLGWMDGASRLTMASPLVVGPVVAVGVLAAGAATMVLRFGGLETVQRHDAVVIRYGLLSTRERVVAADAIIGVELRRNLLELVLRRVRLTLITVDSATRLGSNLVLPSLRERDAARVVATPSFLGVVDSARLPVSRLSAVGTGAATLLVLLSSAAALTSLTVRVLDLRLVHGVPVFVVVVLALYKTGSTALARLRVDRDAGSVTLTTTFVSHREVTLHLAHVHLISAVHLRARPLLVRLHYYAGMPRVLTAVRHDPSQLPSVTRAMTRTHPQHEGGRR